MRKRINLDKYEKPVEAPIGGGFVTGDMHFAMNDSLELKDVMRKVAEKQNVVWVSDGRCSIHQMLVALLDISGPAKVHISSYAMGETPARLLVQLKECGLITALYCVLDNRIDTRSAGSLQVIMSLCDQYSLIDTHAKVTIIQNDHISIPLWYD